MPAEEALRRMDGPTQVSNELVVNPRRGLRRLEVELFELFERRQVRVEDLRLSRRGDEVVIDGHVHEVLSVSAIADTLREVPGGARLVSRIVLSPR